MERPPALTPPVAGSAVLVQEQNGRTKGSTMEAPPPRPSQTGFQGAGPLVRRDKDMIEDARLERRDTAESCLSNFSHQRSNTGWSIAGSAVTDATDLNSPDMAFDEPLDFEPASYSSSPRRSNLFPPMASQKRLPFRNPPISCDTDKSRPTPYGSLPDTPASRHRRLEQTASRKSSLGIYSSAVVPTAMPELPSPREASPPDTSGLLQIPADHDNTQQPVDRASVNNGPRHRSTVGSACPPSLQVQEDTADEIGGWEDGTNASVHTEDDAPTPREATPDPNIIEAPEVEEDRGTPQEPSSSECSEASDGCSQDDGQSTAQPDDSIIHDVCCQILQQAFGVQLRDVALAGAVSAAYESVSYCLDELSHIVLNSGLSNTGIVISETTRDRAGSATVPIWPAGDAAGAAGTGGWNAAGGGSRKRSNGGHDGTDPGDGAGDGSPGGGKRQKVSPTQPQSGNMHFSCPFRKRNPVRFNVRDFQSCAVQSFPDIPQLKRHVKNFHKQGSLLPFTCQRCGRAMRTSEALKKHVSVGVDLICNPQNAPSSADPEDGITSWIEEALNGRKAGSKIDCWETLWRHLFPDDCAIPESDFVPPTELDEVYAQFNSDFCTNRLREQVQERSGPVSDIESTLAVFNNHIESVFEACRSKTSGVAGGRRRLRLQTPRPMTSRRNSVLLTPMPPTPGRRGSGLSDNSFSSQCATPNSTHMSGHVEQPLTAGPHPHPQLRTQYAPPGGSYDGQGVGVAGALMMTMAAGGSPGVNQGGQPVSVPPPAHIHLRFGSQEQDTVLLNAQRGQPRLLPTDSALGLNASFMDQQAADFSNAHSLGSQHGYPPAPDFGQRAPDHYLRPSTQGMPEMDQEVFSSVPSIAFDNFLWDTNNGE